MALPLDAFAAAYEGVPPSERHAYEIITSGPVWSFFDLEAAIDGGDRKAAAAAAGEIAAAATAELARWLPVDHEITTAAFDTIRTCKFSRHLVLRVHRRERDGSATPVPLRSVRDAGILAQRVVRQLSSHQASLVDLCVYAERRAFRLPGSSKLIDPEAARKMLIQEVGDGVVSTDALTLGLIGADPSREYSDDELIAIEPTQLKSNGATGSDLAAARAATVPSSTLAVAHAATVPSAHTSVPQATPQQSAVRAWVAKWQHLTTAPLLDTPRLPHPFVLHRVRHSGPLPPELDRLGRWASAMLRRMQCCSDRILMWEYVRTEHPPEQLLHITGEGGQCHHINRRHAQQNIMLSIDLQNGVAYQRCWDRGCIVFEKSGRGYTSAKHLIGTVPLQCRPPASVLMAVEQIRPM